MASVTTLLFTYLSNSESVFSTSPLGMSRSRNIFKLGLALISINHAFNLLSSSISNPTIWNTLADSWS